MLKEYRGKIDLIYIDPPFDSNPQVYELFDDWRNRRDKFSDASYYSVRKGGQIRIFDNESEIVTDTLFKQMKKYKEAYPNYIYALTMGLGKTILMATCIFYEFLLANKYPKDKRFCHNALVFAPDKTVLQSLREIITFDKTKVVPPEYARVLDANIKFHFLEETGTTLHTIDDSDFNIVISNTQKIIVKKKRKEPKPSEVLFGSGSLLSSIYGDENGDILYVFQLIFFSFSLIQVHSRIIRQIFTDFANPINIIIRTFTGNMTIKIFAHITHSFAQ